MRYLIIGGGIAGTTAAEELRKIDAEASIVLLSEELEHLYSRVLLPHYIKGKVQREKCYLKKPEWYGEKNIEVHFGVIAKQLDAKNKFVLASDGREHEYDKLLIATGGEIKVLDSDNEKISYLRTLEDADHLVRLLAEEPKQASVVGGGFIALEYINIFADRKISTEVHLRGDRFFSSVLDQDSSDLIKEKAQADGVVIHEHSTAHTFDGLVGVGIGIAPDISWIKEAGVETRSGILTNEYLETNLPDVYAAGDVAEFFDPIVERQVHVGNWMNAQMQGRAVAKNMSGTKTAFALVSSYATNCRGMEVIFIGDVDRQAADEVIVKGSKAEGGVAQHFVRNGKLVGATLVNRNSERAAITKMINDKMPYVRTA